MHNFTLFTYGNSDCMLHFPSFFFIFTFSFTYNRNIFTFSFLPFYHHCYSAFGSFPEVFRFVLFQPSIYHRFALISYISINFQELQSIFIKFTFEQKSFLHLICLHFPSIFQIHCSSIFINILIISPRIIFHHISLPRNPWISQRSPAPLLSRRQFNF